jgi:hypothetical protein
MYLAKHVAGWSTNCIGRFYNGRDHSTVIHGIQRIQALRESDPEVDALLSELKDQLVVSQDERDEKKTSGTSEDRRNASSLSFDDLAEAIAERVRARIEERLRK